MPSKSACDIWLKNRSRSPSGTWSGQRGYPRTSNGTVHIGTFEYQAPITLSQTLAAGTYGGPPSARLSRRPVARPPRIPS
jgi:hypothetical protein